LAGNSATFTSDPYKIDKTAPTITGSRTPDANANGWNNTSVTVAFSGTDGLSGVVFVTPNTVLSTEGQNQEVTGTATDAAGNTAMVTVAGINIDVTAPVISLSAPSSGATYGLSQVVAASYSATDAVSGLDCCNGPIPSGNAIDTTSAGPKSFAVQAADKAGNSTNLTVTYTVNLPSDTTAPTTTASSTPDPNSAGWLNSNATVTLNATDNPGGSGVIKTEAKVDGGPWATYSSPLVIDGDGTHTLKFKSTDAAGNVETAKSLTIRIDRSAPTIRLNQPTDGATYVLNEVKRANYSCTATPSGVKSCSGTVPDGNRIETGSVGTKTFTVTAVDKAGNSTTKTITYNVTYGIKVLYDQDQRRNEGSTVPIKIRLIDDRGENVSSSRVKVQAIDLIRKGDRNSISLPGGDDSNFRYDRGDDAYIFNLKTKHFQSGTYVLSFTASNDSVVHTVTFRVK
jgi:large repetitive protein